jgi:hypothetical protein
MGRDAFIIDSKIRINLTRAKALTEVLDFYPDEDKNDLGNLSDCLEDYNLMFRSEQNGIAEFFVDDDDEDEEFDWDLLGMMAPFLEDGSFVEEEPPYIEDEDGHETDGVYIGKVENGEMKLATYTVTQDDTGQKQYHLQKIYEEDW